MRQRIRFLAALGCGASVAAHCVAATFYVSPSGNDTNPGSDTLPWRTIQKAANTLQAGDTVLVQPGTYDEHVSTSRGGTSEGQRIVFRANGTATMKGFVIGHAYVTVEGFDITRHSAASRNSGYLEVNSGGDFFQILNNTIRDGVSIVRNDLTFQDNAPQNDTIASATGGFVSAGFLPGMTFSIHKATMEANLANGTSLHVIEGVTDNTLTLQASESLNNDGPKPAYLTGSYVYGLVVQPGASGGIVRSNRFSNLDYDSAFIGGENNLYEFNTFERCNGWEAMHFVGISNVFRRNLIRQCALKKYDEFSPDVFETFPGSTTRSFTFEENFVEGFNGVLGILRNATGTNMHDVVFQRNVFIDVGRFVVRVYRVSFLNNTFYRVAERGTVAVSSSPHPIVLESNALAYGAVLKNNVFVGCGDQSRDVDLHGWYELIDMADYTADYNFVAGASPSFAAKVGFDEGHPSLNGGDPGFVNISNPLGPDGIPFTDDDGLRLRADSKLRGQGEGGVDLGAYQGAAVTRPTLTIAIQPNDAIRLSWPTNADGFALQSTATITSGWGPTSEPPSTQGDQYILVINPTNAAAFYRLAK